MIEECLKILVGTGKYNNDILICFYLSSERRLLLDSTSKHLEMFEKLAS